MVSIAQFGTFEVDNYGDRLFPVILEKELASRLSGFKLQLYSPLPEHNSDTIKPIIIPGNRSCFSEDRALDAIILGGGDIISFRGNIAPFYQHHWHHRMSPHTACWAIPTIHRPPGVPVIWNAPGVPYEFTKDQAAFIRHLAAQTDYLSVRDEISLSHLRHAGIDQPVAVVPDTALMLPKHFPADELKPFATKIFEVFGCGIGEPILFQIHPAISEKLIPDITRHLHKLKAKLGRPVLLLPIGNCHHDRVILEKLKMSSGGVFQLVEDKLDVLNMAAVIAHAGCFIGTSLHGNVTAFAYQVPHLIYNAASLAKLRGFTQLIQEPDRCFEDYNDMLNRCDLLNKRPSSDLFNKLCGQITNHFDHIATIILKTESSYVKQYDTSLLVDHIQVIHDMQKWKEQLDQIQNSKAWHLACLLKKVMNRLPFVKILLNRDH